VTLERPLANFSFYVTLDPADAYLPPAQAKLIPYVAVGAFQEVHGLGADLEVLPYAEGGVNAFAHQLPTKHTWSRISLKRGVVRNDSLFDWYRAGLTLSLGARRGGSVVLMTPGGVAAVAWSWRGGLAVKWSGPDLNAVQGAVAVEGLEIAHEGLEQVVLSAPEVG
jgi:phage tail-like protein